jgi:hypothetical protein
MIFPPSEPRIGWNAEDALPSLGGSSAVHMIALGSSLAGATVFQAAGAAEADEALPEADAATLDTGKVELAAEAVEDNAPEAELTADEDAGAGATELAAGAETATVANARRVTKLEERRNMADCEA